jgi:hypothetical protein
LKGNIEISNIKTVVTGAEEELIAKYCDVSNVATNDDGVTLSFYQNIDITTDQKEPIIKLLCRVHLGWDHFLRYAENISLAYERHQKAKMAKQSKGDTTDEK